MTPDRLTLLFRVDVVANLALAAASFVTLSAPQVLGLPRPVLGVVGVALVANAWDLARTVRRRTPVAAVRRSGAIDLAFAAGLLVVAAAGLGGPSTTGRWVLTAVGDVSLVVGGLKLYGIRATRLATARPA